MIARLIGRATARQAQLGSEDRAILSFSLLLAALVSGFVTALGQAAPSASFLNLITILN